MFQLFHLKKNLEKAVFNNTHGWQVLINSSKTKQKLSEII